MNKSMRLYVSLTTALLLALLTGAACNKQAEDISRTVPPSAQAQTTPPPDGVRRIGISEVQAALEKGEAVIVDVRGSVEYKLGRIKGSVSVPLGLIAQQIKELPRDKLIVTYCA